MSGCLNHPTVEAVGRCKQCGKPFCSACHVKGPTGNFCSDECKAAHETFTRRAAQLDNMKATGGFGRIVKRVVILAIVLVVITVGAGMMGIEIPVLSELLRNFTGD